MQHAEKIHKGDDLGVLPIGTTFGPFYDDTDWYVTCVLVAKLHEFDELIPYFLELFSTFFYFSLAIGIVLVDRVPRRITRARDGGEHGSGDLPVAIIRVLGIGQPS